jgi:hypothetical protein
VKGKLGPRVDRVADLNQGGRHCIDCVADFLFQRGSTHFSLSLFLKL